MPNGLSLCLTCQCGILLWPFCVVLLLAPLHIYVYIVLMHPQCIRGLIIIIIIIMHEFYGDTSLKQNFRTAVNVMY